MSITVYLNKTNVKVEAVLFILTFIFVIVTGSIIYTMFILILIIRE